MSDGETITKDDAWSDGFSSGDSYFWQCVEESNFEPPDNPHEEGSRDSKDWELGCSLGFILAEMDYYS